MISKCSENAELVKMHYKNLLGEHYTWMFGGTEHKLLINKSILEQYILTNLSTESADWSNGASDALSPLGANIANGDSERVYIDLGCGSGFQTIPLLQMGHKVIAIDSADVLLHELKQNAESNNCDLSKLETIDCDLLLFPHHISTKVDGFICMGDTLTHLASLDEVARLLKLTFESLKDGGVFLLQFRDLTKPLKGCDRFIPVKSDERTVFTCFLEWIDDAKSAGDSTMIDGIASTSLDGSEEEQSDNSGCIIKVHDLVHVKKGIGAWELCSSWYQKLGITAKTCKIMATKVGFTVEDGPYDGNVFLILRK